MWVSEQINWPFIAIKEKTSRSRANMWSAIPNALLCMIMIFRGEAGQLPWRGRSPVKHRGTFIRTSTRPSVVWGLRGQILSLRGLITDLTGLIWDPRELTLSLRGLIWGLRGRIWGPRVKIWGLRKLISGSRGLIWGQRGLNCGLIGLNQGFRGLIWGLGD